MEKNEGQKIDKFVNLHVHSAIGSLLDSVARIPDIVKFAKEHNQIAVALTDHGKMSGFVDLYKECKNAGIKPIMGVEAYEVDNMYEKADTKEYVQPRYHWLLLAKNKKGLQNLFKIVTVANTEGFYKKPLITLDESITENEERYTGLGYVVTYDLDCTQEDDVRLCKIISSEYSFLVFINGKIFMNKENLWKQL